MNPAVFIDANVPIYAAGRDHPYKDSCARILRLLAGDPQSFLTDSEVLQEMMRRHLSSGR
jgi:predicted nucleic acid-binding protein